MPNTINIPTPLRPFTDKKEAVEVSGATVGELLLDLTTRYEGLRKHLYADNGKLRNFVNVYLNDEDIRYLQREADAGQGWRHAEHRAVCRRRGADDRGTARDGSLAGRNQTLQPASDHAGDGHGRSAQAETVQCVVHRRRRTWFPGCDVSRCCGHRPPRHRRLRRR